MPEETTEAWAFTSPLSLAEMKKALDAKSPDPWVEGDSAWHGDYLGQRLTPEAIARIYEVDDHYVLNLLFHSEHGDVEAQLAAAEKEVKDVVLATVQARDVSECEALE